MKFAHISVGLLFSLCLLPLYAGATDLQIYKGERPPSEAMLIKNIQALGDLAYQGRGPSGRVDLVLGSHYRETDNLYQLYYCSRLASRGGSYSSTEGCQGNILILRLDSGLWIMKYSDNSRWRVISN